MGRLEGKHALVTGGSMGIGEAVARRFVEEGARVIVAARHADRGREVVRSLGPKARWHRLDVTDAAGWRGLVARLERDPLDVLVNNAGELLFAKQLHEIEPDEWRQEIETNLTGAFLGMRYCIPMMLANRGGSIINMGSISGIRGQDDGAGYQAAKGGLRLLSANAAFTYASRGIRVNVISPGAISTPKVASEPWERTKPFIDRTPMKRMADPVEVAHVAVFLASDESSFVTGSDYGVDGGYAI